MAKNLRKVISTVIVLALLISVMSVSALASNDSYGEPMPEPESNLPTAPREDPDVTIEILPSTNEKEETEEVPPAVPEYEFPVIPPVVDVPVVEIEVTEVPEVEEEEIVDELAEEIPDEEVPLADVPYTGGMGLLWLVLSGLSAAVLFIPGGKRKQ